METAWEIVVSLPSGFTILSFATKQKAYETTKLLLGLIKQITKEEDKIYMGHDADGNLMQFIRCSQITAFYVRPSVTHPSEEMVKIMKKHLNDGETWKAEE